MQCGERILWDDELCRAHGDLYRGCSIWTSAGHLADHIFTLANAAYMRLIGNRKVLGLPVREAMPDIEGQGFFEILDDCYRSGRPFVGTGVTSSSAATSAARSGCDRPAKSIRLRRFSVW